MPIPISCSCGKRYQAPDNAAGKFVRCKNCNALMKVALVVNPAPANPPEPDEEIVVATLTQSMATNSTVTPPVVAKSLGAEATAQSQPFSFGTETSNPDSNPASTPNASPSASPFDLSGQPSQSPLAYGTTPSGNFPTNSASSIALAPYSTNTSKRASASATSSKPIPISLWITGILVVGGCFLIAVVGGVVLWIRTTSAQRMNNREVASSPAPNDNSSNPLVPNATRPAPVPDLDFEAGENKEKLVAYGRKLFRERGCRGCHSTELDKRIYGPTLAGSWGREFTDGVTGAAVKFDELYVRESLESPQQKKRPEFVEGVQMPSFRGKLGSEEINAITALIVALEDGRISPEEEASTSLLELSGARAENNEPMKDEPANVAQRPLFIRTLENGILFGQTKGTLNGPGGQTEFNVYLPEGQHPQHSLGCVLITPGNTNLLMGTTLADGTNHDETLPYAKAGYAVVHYSLDGYTDVQQSNTGQIREAYLQFKRAEAGWQNTRAALDFVQSRLPEVNPKRVFLAGYASAGTVSLLGAKRGGPRIAGCITYAPFTDPEAFHKDMIRDPVANRIFPDMQSFDQMNSPIQEASVFNTPLFVFQSRIDRVVRYDDTLRYIDEVKKVNRNVEFAVVDSGDHLDSILKGIPAGIEWLKRTDKTSNN